VTPEGQAVLIAAGGAAVTGALGAVGVWALARRSVRAALVAAPLVVDASVAAGVLLAAREMFINEHDVQLVLLVVLAAVPVALAYGWLLARRVHRLDRELERRLAAEQAAYQRETEVEQQRRDLIAWASHDLRTPVAGIRAMAEALEDGVAPADGSYAARIRMAADRLGDMVDDLLALSRISSGRLVLRPEPIGLHDLVSDALAAARPLALEAGVELEGAAPTRASVVADPRELARVLDNLVVNAIRASPRGARVQVIATPTDAGALLRVADECGGLDEPTRARMFEPWWRGDEARTAGRGEAAGLGLAVVRGLVEAHGGQVHAADAPGGCVIEVRLPNRPAD